MERGLSAPIRPEDGASARRGTLAGVVETLPQPVAVLFRDAPGPAQQDGAHIAFRLRQAGIHVLTPIRRPRADRDSGWAFPDTEAGVSEALAAGARVLWAHTVVHTADHPLAAALQAGARVVGQPADVVGRFGDKWATREILRAAGLPVPPGGLIGPDGEPPRGAAFPLVVKPIRRRGSEGAKVVANADALRARVAALRAADGPGQPVLAEAYLPGIEAAVTVMPPGRYEIGLAETRFSGHWALPPVIRLRHEDGIAPDSARVPATAASRLIDAEERMGMRYADLLRQCEQAADLIGARSPIRIDCRAGADGGFRLFGADLRPALTGPGRLDRGDSDSLAAIAAHAVGWTDTDLLLNLLRQAWAAGDTR